MVQFAAVQAYSILLTVLWLLAYVNKPNNACHKERFVHCSCEQNGQAVGSTLEGKGV
jgi:hypothetical protein